MIIGKRQVLLSVLVLALGAAVFVNWYCTKPDSVTTEKQNSVIQKAEPGANLGDAKYVLSSDVTESSNKADEFFAGAKNKRKEAHDTAAETLNDIIKDTSSSEKAVSEAAEKLKQLADAYKFEADIENLIGAKLGCRNIVIINGEITEIIVENGTLDEAAAVQIKEIAMKNSGCDADNVNIIEAKY